MSEKKVEFSSWIYVRANNKKKRCDVIKSRFFFVLWWFFANKNGICVFLSEIYGLGKLSRGIVFLERAYMDTTYSKESYFGWELGMLLMV